MTGLTGSGPAARFGPFAELPARFTQLDLEGGHVVDATGPAGTVSEALLAAFRTGRLAFTIRLVHPLRLTLGSRRHQPAPTDLRTRTAQLRFREPMTGD